MSKGLALNITAVDRATRVINGLNRRVREMNAPVRNMQRSMSQFARATGLGVMKEKLEGIGHTARRVGFTFARIGAPLAALVGGGTLAGVYELTAGWARFGMHLSQTAQILGVNTQQLYNFQNAARLVGVSGRAATDAYQGFANTLQDARFGRNQQAMGLLLGLGIHLQNTKSGSVDAMKALGDIAHRIHAFQQAGHFGAARTLASQLGLTALLPLLMQGRRRLEALEAQAQKYSGIMHWKLAGAAAKQWNKLDVSMYGVRNTIGAGLLPVITPLVIQFGNWINANRAVIATDLSGFVKGLGRAFRGLTLKTVLDDILAIVRGMGRLASDVLRVVRNLGGFKRVLEGMAAAWAVGKVIKFGLAIRSVARWTRAATKSYGAWRLARAGAPEASGGATAAEGAVAGTTAGGLLAATGIGLVGGAAVYGGAKVWENHQIGKLHDRMKVAPMASAVMRYFERQGWTRNQAAGISANIQAESGFNPRKPGDGGAAYGLGQWHPARQAQFDAWARRNKLPDIRHAGMLEQLRYYNYELKHTLAGRKLAATSGAYQAGEVVSKYDERPAKTLLDEKQRGALAMEIAGPPPTPVQVSVQTTVHRDGASSTRVRTPQGVKVLFTSPVYGVS